MSEQPDFKVLCRTIKGEKREVLASDLTFRPSIYGIIIQDGNVLLVPQWDGYDFPGGGVHKGEPFLKALVREVKEESGMDAEPGELVGVFEDLFLSVPSEKPLHSILMYYTAKAVGGGLSDEGFTEFEKTMSKTAEWVPLDQIHEIKFYNPVNSPALIRKALAMQR